MHYLERNVSYLDSNFIGTFSLGSSWQYVHICSGKGLTSNMRQAFPELILFIDAHICVTRGPLYEHELTLIRVWINNYLPSNVWDGIIHQFPNFNGCAVEVWEWVSNFILHFIMDVTTHLCWDLSQSTLVKVAPGIEELCNNVSQFKLNHSYKSFLQGKF